MHHDLFAQLLLYFGGQLPDGYGFGEDTFDADGQAAELAERFQLLEPEDRGEPPVVADLAVGVEGYMGRVEGGT